MTTVEFQHKLVHLQKHLILFAFRLTLNTEKAHDLLQETNLKVLAYRDKFIYDTNFKAWTFTIMRNTFINEYRRHVRQKYVDIENFPAISIQLKSHENYDPCSIYETKELEKIVESMDEKFKVPFKMRFEGFKYKEIAEVLDLKIGTVKSRIFLARKKLTKQLE